MSDVVGNSALTRASPVDSLRLPLAGLAFRRYRVYADEPSSPRAPHTRTPCRYGVHESEHEVHGAVHVRQCGISLQQRQYSR